MPDTLEGEVVDLLRHLIANACVNDGSIDSGNEIRNAELLATYLDVPGIELETYEPAPGRRSLLARLERSSSAPRSSARHRGIDHTSAPTLLLVGHTDVVPAESESWQHDPFGGDLVDGWIWGRGAVDMLNLTASMAVAMKHMALRHRSTPLPGDLLLLAVADEEALSNYGARFLTEHHPDAMQADAMITESGGIPIPAGGGLRLPVIVAEKGTYWCRITVRGTPGHGSRPFRSDNALVTAAEVVRRVSSFQPPAYVPDAWRRFVEGLELELDVASSLTSADSVDQVCEILPTGLAREAHASTHTTFAPTVCRAGEKTNVIPGSATVEVDIRTLPGQSAEHAHLMLLEALGDLSSQVEIAPFEADEASSSPVDTPLWETLNRTARHFYQGSATLPMLSVGATDARFFRRLGIPSYGFGMFSTKISIEEFASMFHGNDERVDTESVVLSTRMWMAVASDYLG